MYPVDVGVDTTMAIQTLDSLHEQSARHAAIFEFEEAISVYRASLAIESLLQEYGMVAQTFYRIGEAFYELSEYDSSLYYLDSALVLARVLESENLECRILNKVGENRERMSEFEKALAFYDSALTVAIAMKDKHMEGLILCNIGWTLDALSNYKEAIVYHDSARAIAHTIGDRHIEGRILRRLGTTCSVLGQYDRALAYYDSAFVIARETEDRRLEGRTLMGIGRVKFALDDYDETLAINRLALDVMRATRDMISEGYVLDCSGMAYRMRCEYDSAFACHRAALAMRRKVKDRMGEGNALVNLGLTYIDEYKYEEALAYLDSGLAIAKAIKNNAGKEIIYISVGSILDDLARYETALAYYDSALVISRETGEKMREGSLLMYIGGIYHDLKQYERALLYYDSAWVCLRELRIEYIDALILVYAGAAYCALKQYRRAISVYDSALVKIRAICEQRLEGVILHNMSNVYFDLGQYDTASAYLDSAFVLVDKVHNMFRKASILSQRGTIFRMQEEYDRALAYYDSALVVAREVKDQSTEGTTLHEIGYLCEQVSDMEKAVTFYKQSIDVKESIREALQREELRTYYIEAERNIYERLINLLIILERYKEAFDYMERSRSQKIRRRLEGQDIVAFDPSLRRIQQRINFVEAEMHGLNLRLREGRLLHDEYVQKMNELEGRYNQLMFDLKTYHPEYYDFMVPQIISLENMQGRIPENTIFVEYVLAGDYYTVFLVADKLFLLKKLTYPRSLIDSVIRGAMGDLRWLRDKTVIDAHLQDLYLLLMEPLEATLNDFGDVIIIPWGLLHYVPFHALRKNRAQGHGYEYVMEWKRVNYLPSAQFLQDLSPIERKQEERLLAFANCDGTLPCAEIEVDSICEIYPDACICKKDSATKEQFITMCGEYELLHLATHGILDSDPRFSYIVFAPAGTGNLTVREILGLSGRFDHTSLVTLSSCETAIEEDPEKAGMELTTLAVAFKMAGVPSIVATLWEIADRSTAVFMKHFYASVKVGKSRSECLRQAQIAVKEHSDYMHPYYWAPFILIGSWQ
jgi:CHAT domain-containing protein/tetratricopeptide (TPR) repeat protein